MKNPGRCTGIRDLPELHARAYPGLLLLEPRRERLDRRCACEKLEVGAAVFHESRRIGEQAVEQLIVRLAALLMYVEDMVDGESRICEAWA